jgi:hypothetical protein
VELLVRVQNSRTVAHGAHALERGEDRRANELGPVGDALHRLDQGFLGLEGDDLLFAAQSGHDLPPEKG